MRLASFVPLAFLFSLSLTACEQSRQEQKALDEQASILAPLIDPEKLDNLKGKRAATPRLRKACY